MLNETRAQIYSVITSGSLNPSKKLSKSARFRSELNNLMEISTIQGLPKVFLSKRGFLRLSWFILTLVSVCACAYFSTNSVMEYFSYDTITSFKTINEHVSEFPSMTLCHYNNTNFTFNVLDFSFNRQNLTNDWKNHFDIYEDKKYGKCYRFNSVQNMFGNQTEIKKLKFFGFEYGLNLDIYVPVGSTDYGEFKIHFYNYTQIPSTIHQKGMFISSGNWHYFKIKRTYEIKLEEPYNKCIKDAKTFDKDKTLIDFIFKKNMTYSQNECLRLCLNYKYIQLNSTKCRLSTLNDDLYLYCYRSIRNDTIRNETLNFIETFQNNDPYQTCSMYCPLECDSFNLEVDHDFEPIMLHSSSSAHGFFYRQFNNYENVSRSFLSIHVSYDDLKYTLITQQEKWRVYDLISNVGGTLGLFLGMGLLSFAELIEIFIEFILILCNK